MKDETTPGLEGVIVAETRLSQVDGEQGRLVVCGHDVEALAREHGFEAACGLLFDGVLPDASRCEALRRGLGEARVRAHAQLPELGTALETSEAMDALRAAMAHATEAPGEALDAKLAITGAVAVVVAAWQRTRLGRPPLPPDPALGHATDLLRMLDGTEPSPARAAALDAYLVTVAEHGMNASTFTARVVASTGSDAVSAVVAALGALKGPLHGGAPGPVLDMLDGVSDRGDAEAWLRDELASGRRIMGLGHRVYRVRDPRAAVLEQAVTRLEAAGAESRYLAIAREVEKAAVGVLAERHPERSLQTNVEFYTAVLLDAVGIPRDLFTGVFTVGRVAGWLAHVDDQREHGRLIRPRQRYVGPAPQPALAG